MMIGNKKKEWAIPNKYNWNNPPVEGEEGVAAHTWAAAWVVAASAFAVVAWEEEHHIPAAAASAFAVTVAASLEAAAVAAASWEGQVHPYRRHIHLHSYRHPLQNQWAD